APVRAELRPAWSRRGLRPRRGVGGRGLAGTGEGPGPGPDHVYDDDDDDHDEGGQG
ncbi:MAG: hypothetical protein HY905_17345, partial [Deltaproteobacteria bacterium]|nr:hypothetical protein [Deltaproteobacteria bacterium]